MSSTKYPTPLASPTETYLLKRGERFHKQAAPSLVVRLKQVPEKTVQLPRELALSLVRRRAAYVVADLNCQPELILTEEDLDEMQSSGFDLWNPTQPITQ